MKLYISVSRIFIGCFYNRETKIVIIIHFKLKLKCKPFSAWYASSIMKPEIELLCGQSLLSLCQTHFLQISRNDMLIISNFLLNVSIRDTSYHNIKSANAFANILLTINACCVRHGMHIWQGNDFYNKNPTMQTTVIHFTKFSNRYEEIKKINLRRKQNPYRIVNLSIRS